MYNHQQTQTLTPKSQEEPKLGFLGKAFVGLGSLTSGLGAGIVYVNKKLFENVAHGLLATADSQMEAAMTYLGNVTKNAGAGSREEQFKQFIDSLPALNPNEHVLHHQQAVRRDLRDADTVLGKALEDASKGYRGEKLLHKINFHRIAQQNYWEFANQHPETERTANALIRQEYESRRLAYDVGTTINLEARQALGKETVKHVPFPKKIALNGLRLTTGQQIGAGVVFAAVSSIAACGFYRLSQWFSYTKEHESIQR